MKKRVFWIAIFLCATILDGYILFEYLGFLQNWSFRDLRDVVLILIVYYGLFLFVFKRKSVLPAKFWRFFFWIYILDLVLTHLGYIPEIEQTAFYSLFYKSNYIVDISKTEQVICLCFILLPLSYITLVPILYSLFKLGRNKKSSKALNSLRRI